MHRSPAVAWVVSACSVSSRLSQAKTFSILAAAAMRVQRVSLANTGRMMEGSVEHQIKRCWRFCANDRVETADAMRGVVSGLPKEVEEEAADRRRLGGRQGLSDLMASAVLKGRSTPIAWAGTTNHLYEGHRSRNAFEESLLLVLRDVIPRRVRVVILAGARPYTAGSRPGLWAHRLGDLLPETRLQLRDPHQAVGHGPPARRSAASCGTTRSRMGSPGQAPPRPEMLKRVSCRSDQAVTQNVVIRWRKDLPKKRDECRFLMTDQPGTAHQFCKLYGQRMTIEELFRDGKSERNGCGGPALQLEPARHQDHQARAPRPFAADPGNRVTPAVRGGTGGQAAVHPVGLVLDRP